MLVVTLALAGPPTVKAGDFRMKVLTAQAWLLARDEVKLSFFAEKNTPCDPGRSSFSSNSLVFAPRGEGDSRYWVLDAVFSEGGDAYGLEMGRYPDPRSLAERGADAFRVEWDDSAATSGDDLRMNFGGTFPVMACGSDKQLLEQKAKAAP